MQVAHAWTTLRTRSCEGHSNITQTATEICNFKDVIMRLCICTGWFKHAQSTHGDILFMFCSGLLVLTVEEETANSPIKAFGVDVWYLVTDVISEQLSS